MRVFLMTAVLCSLAATAMAAEDEALTTPEQRLGYLYGYGPVGQHVKQFAEQYGLDNETILAGLADALAGKDSLVPEAEQQELFAVLESKREARAAEAAVDNIAKGKEYLESVRQRDGVITLESGLSYEILVAGEGPRPTASDTVVCHYRGTLIDGTEFDSSYSRGEPASFQLDQVIPGWTEALQLMPVGSKWRLYLPPELGYGNQAPPSIGPGQVLIFEVELLEIVGG